MGFEKLFDWLYEIWQLINPFIVVKEYEEGIVLRYGKFHRLWKPGLHLKVPFIDEYMEHFIVPTTLSLSSQSLITKDAKNIVVKAVIKYRIQDVKVFLLEVYDSNDAISDITQSVIKNVIMTKTFEECTDDELDLAITKKARVEARKWGVEILQVTLVDIAPIRTMRIINDTTTNSLT